MGPSAIKDQEAVGALKEADIKDIYTGMQITWIGFFFSLKLLARAVSYDAESKV